VTWEPPAAPGSTRTNLICNTGVLNQPAVDRHSVPIKGTEKRRLPKWMEPHRDRLTHFVRSNTEAGMVPMSDFKTMRICVGPKATRYELKPHERTRWFQEAQIWQDLLLSESDPSRA
jgi:hypothetical protein